MLSLPLSFRGRRLARRSFLVTTAALVILILLWLPRLSGQENGQGLVQEVLLGELNGSVSVILLLLLISVLKNDKGAGRPGLRATHDVKLGAGKIFTKGSFLNSH